MKALQDLKYSGRGIGAGMTLEGNPFLAYTLTGRSKSSQARALRQEKPTQTVRTEVTDQEQLANGSAALLIYPALLPVPRGLAASNGIQTELIYSAALRNPSLSDPLKILLDAFKEPQWRYDKGNERSGDRWMDITIYEPDEPNYTPRISALLIDTVAAMHIVYRGEEGRKMVSCQSFTIQQGQGKMLTTYNGGNEKPLLSSTGDLLTLQIKENSIAAIADSLYQAIKGGASTGDNFGVAVAVALFNKRTQQLEYALRNRN